MPRSLEAGRATDAIGGDWPSQAARLRAIRWQAEAHLERGEFAAAAEALSRAFDLLAPGEDEFFRGLYHLAAAGYRHQTGNAAGAASQLERARRRLAPFPAATHLLDCVGGEIGK